MKKRILFVGGDPAVCREFQAQNSGPDAAWTVQSAGSGEEALALCYQASFDAVVADVRLSGMSGPDFLNALMRQQPKAMRIVLSDMADTESTMKCVGQAHHHMLKPCAAATLTGVLGRAFAREAWLPSAPVQGLMAQMRHVPSPPKAYFQVVEEMRSPSCSIEKIADLISNDPAITAKVLQLANSALFGLELNVVRPLEAIGYIGLETTKAIVLLAHTFSSFDQLKLTGFSVDELWRHSVRTGQYAQHIATMESTSPGVSEQAFAGGLLHDIGKLLFAANHAGMFAKVLRLAREQHCNLWEAEAQLLPGMGHAELGATVLSIWGLPAAITEAVALHHCPWNHRIAGFNPVTAVHAANILDHETHPDPAIILPSQINTAYLKDLGLAGRVDQWRRQCQAFG
jgi:HD-like signal output (HDOD) protein/ActR/RegA family two-component response regulator